MSKRQKKKQKAKGVRRNSPYSDYNISRIIQHKRQGDKLSPPFVQIPKMTPTSWADDHMPEMLWAVLLTGVLERKHYLNLFRKIAVLSREWFIIDEAGETTPKVKLDEETGINSTVVVDHTKLAEINDEQFDQFISIPFRHPLGYAALRPLLLIDSLPGRERWRRALDVDPLNSDWETLASAIGGTLDHQSEKSTDIRWFKLILPSISGRMIFPISMVDEIEEIRFFPNRGDMRQVRPFIRASEMAIRRDPPSAWLQTFWNEMLEKTDCINPSKKDRNSFVETLIDPKTLYAVRYAVIQRFMQNMTSKRTDPRLDSGFGIVFYALAIVEEIGFHRVQTRIMGRLGLRALVEANITLRYLVEKDSEELWKSYRVYGAGQAKLAFLKAQELEGDLPIFIDEDALYAIANEDIWQEFLNIDIGHWANSNLRKLSIDCGAKALYDKYYDWASAFSHGHWGAVRDTNFVTCHNPLHRLHRIPRLLHRSLNSVEADAIDLTNEMLGLLDRLFPGKNSLEKLSLDNRVKAQSREGDTDIAGSAST